MNKKLLLFLLIILIFTDLTKSIGLTGDAGLVKQKLNLIGFEVGKIKVIKPGEFRVNLIAFSPSKFEVQLLPQRSFRKFHVIAIVHDGTVFIRQSILIAHGFKIGTNLPEGLQIVRD